MIEITRITDEFSVCAQLRPEDMSEIAKRGFRSVINNRPDGEGGPEQPVNADIALAARDNGLHYTWLPVTSGAITTEQAREMAAWLGTADRPLLAFCRSGARSTKLFNMAQAWL